MTAQTKATITGTVQDTSGNLATSGTVVFQISPNSGGLLYYIANTTTIAPTNSTLTISGSGTISGSLWGNDLITPANTCYTMTMYPNGVKTTSVKVLITGSSFNINNPVFCPNISVLPQQANISTYPFGTNIFPTTAHQFNIGSPALPYGAGYIDNIFSNTITATNFNINNVTTCKQNNTVYLISVCYATLQAAVTAAGTGGTVIIPVNTTITVDTTTPVTITNSHVTIQGAGHGAIIALIGTGDLFQTSALDFTLRDLRLSMSQTSNRTTGCIINSTAAIGHVYNIYIQSNATATNGCFTEHTIGSGVFNYDQINILGTGTWTWIGKTLGSGSTTVANTDFDHFTIHVGVTCSDACWIPDTLTDTFTIENSTFVPSSGLVINPRNSTAGQAPRWMTFTNVRIENAATGNCIQIDDGQVFQFIGGYIATCLVGVVVNKVDNLDISHNIIVNMQQGAIQLNPSGTAAKVTHSLIGFNEYQDTTSQTTNTYDTISIGANTQQFSINHSTWRQFFSANVPRYGVNIGAGTSNLWNVSDNDGGSVAFGTAMFLNNSSGLNQVLFNNFGTTIKEQITRSVDVCFGSLCAKANSGGFSVGTSGSTIADTRNIIQAVYNHSGTNILSSHLVQDTCILGTSCTVTLTGSAVFTSATSYTCSCHDNTIPANACSVSQTSSSAVAFTGIGTDTLFYWCGGN